MTGADFGTIDAEVREIARAQDATLLTSNAVMAEVARIEGLRTKYFEPSHVEERPRLPALLRQEHDVGASESTSAPHG